MHKLLLFILTIFLAGCSSYRPVPSANQGVPTYNPPTIQQSLFTDKDATISEENIQLLLNGSIRFPDSLRIAILNYSNSSVRRYYTYYHTDEEYLKLQQSYIDLFRSKLDQLDPVHRTMLMPSLLVTNDAGITQLREAAVRLQSDLLLIFSIRSDLYSKTKLFKKDEYKAFATCELLLMDIRTGVIPFSSVETSDHLVKKSGEDFNDSEARKRAEQGAILKTLEGVSGQLVDYLNTI